MISVSLSTLATVLSAKHNGMDITINQVVLDSRKITQGCLFIALKGEQFDGHDFAFQALQAGAAGLLVERFLPLDIPQLQVADTRLALGTLAAWVRQHVSARVVALTGSSGKTSVKEMVAGILQQCGTVLYTAGNLNNDIGVPMTLLRLTPEHQYAVLELGANHIGEIAYTADLVKPEAALVNNLAASHLEGFGSLAGVAQAKGEIFASLPAKGIAVINADNHDEKQWAAILQDRQVWRFSSNQTENIDFYVTHVCPERQGYVFMLHTPFGQMQMRLPVLGRHNITNALAAAALSMAAGAPLSAVSEGLAQHSAVPGRLFPLSLGEDKLLLDDSYNANVGSMLAAISTLAEMPGYRVLVVGDMAELGEASAACHRQVGKAASDVVDKILSVGIHSEQISGMSGDGEHFIDQTALIQRLAALCRQHTVISILVKGSRSARMERVVQGLQETI